MFGYKNEMNKYLSWQTVPIAKPLSQVVKRFVGCGITKHLQALTLALILSLSLALPASASPLLAGLPPGNPIKDPEALLRLALPFENNAIREVQLDLEDVNTQVRGRRWKGVKADVSKALKGFKRHREDILASVTPRNQANAADLADQIVTNLEALEASVADQNADEVFTRRAQVLSDIGTLEASMVEGFPFEIPEEYRALPQLKGRATVDMETSKGHLIIGVDGFNAPVTAGNFVDLVQRKFYNGLEFNRSEESYILQGGDPKGDDVGFVDPKTKQYRAIPLEIRTEDADEPLYGMTLEEAGRYLEYPRLPFSAYGAIALAHSDDSPNDGSSQFFFHLFESELTPAGSNMLDGRYAIFGYVTQGTDVLREMRQGDKIISAKVVKGAENLVKPKTR